MGAPYRTTVVLVVEDEPLIRLLLVDFMIELGHSVLEASSADEAIEILEANPAITIVVTDIQMAGSMDGLALAHYSAERWPPIKFLIVSAGTTPHETELPVGAKFLAKPYKSEVLSEIIRGFAQQQTEALVQLRGVPATVMRVPGLAEQIDTIASVFHYSHSF